MKLQPAAYGAAVFLLSALLTYPACQRAVATFVTGPTANISNGAAIPGSDADLLKFFNVRLGYVCTIICDLVRISACLVRQTAGY